MGDHQTASAVNIERVKIEGEAYFKISNSNAMRPFFMSIVSDSNHWMFIASNGGLTAGRKNSEYALFPYYTDDKITESAEVTGSKSLFRVSKGGESLLWEPFSIRQEGQYTVSRNLYKNTYGNKVLFEEINHDLGLTFRYKWASSDAFGFVRQSTLVNQNEEAVSVHLLDGIQNILPQGVNSDLQTRQSNLVDAYKKSELEKPSGLGIYALSAIIVDRAEPSEALKANIAWSCGLESPTYLLSSLQLDAFRKGLELEEEIDMKAEKGAYFVSQEIQLEPHAEKQWMILADVNKNHADIARIMHEIEATADLPGAVRADIRTGTQRLIALNAAADGFQLTADGFRDARHFSNVLFNIMRGGIFDHHYQMEKEDLRQYLAKANTLVFKAAKPLLDGLPDLFTLGALRSAAQSTGNPHLLRLCLEYLPLKFSRRHGDPSRPWNKFSINTRSEVDGSKILDYEGNWRDIFQNWEALAHSYPRFVESMVHKFLNATTFDGYNPYRVTKDGFDWETIEPDDAWSYIGYWGDHQIIYLLKLLEFWEQAAPGDLQRYFNEDLFVYANVPYKIKPFGKILEDSKDTIEFDFEADESIREKREQIGADGALLSDQSGDIYRVNFIEKILASLLAKLSNFIPEGGIWMNTQRPEWNDANNALVGNGVSMVTLYYMRRFLHFFDDLFAQTEVSSVRVSAELLDCFEGIFKTFNVHQEQLSGAFSDKGRMAVLTGLGEAGSRYRTKIYTHAFSGQKHELSVEDLKAFVKISQAYLDHAIAANKRADGLYHAYNLMAVEEDGGVSIDYLDEMLEGQVAVLSAGALSAAEALEVLDGLKGSALFRNDQYSYILYPNKDLGRFMAKNNIPEDLVQQSSLFQKLLEDGHTGIVYKDINGTYHFNGNFKNANDLKAGLDGLTGTPYQALAEADRKAALKIFEQVFNHKAFTGRSGTFFGYEGLGSIYWHMVSKLQLAVQECCLSAIAEQASPKVVGRLLEHYYEINEGIGVHKSPELYGAFPTDPYSHTPAGKGAQQPGMTGQVKEDILSRFGELGVFFNEGQLQFDPCLLRKEEFLNAPRTFHYLDLAGKAQDIKLEAGSLAFTICQVPVVYQLGGPAGLQVVLRDGTQQRSEATVLSKALSREVFGRTGNVTRVTVSLDPKALK
ncbi:MAG: hypothetical protein RIC19_03345 [Phaeodactylibacter sp.]|uniref:hypothetical protein n=1 Tax=Phaeodactylibacter sp. TaxID=1940289 RepID=UPI0032EB9EFC